MGQNGKKSIPDTHNAKESCGSSEDSDTAENTLPSTHGPFTNYKLQDDLPESEMTETQKEGLGVHPETRYLGLPGVKSKQYSSK